MLLCLVAGVFALADEPTGLIRVGAETILGVETPHPVAGSALPGAEIWRDVFSSPKASYIAVHFARFELAAGEQVRVETPDGRYSYVFEGDGKALSGGEFWATHVPGERCVVRYFGNGGTPGYGYAVDSIAHGDPAPERPLILTPDATEAICGSDDSQEAKCYQTSNPEIYNPSRAVARLLIAGVNLCTGWLVGCEGHVLTNAHCIGSDLDARNTDFEFLAEGASCSTNCSSPGACPGTIVASTSTLVKKDDLLDYALVRLPTNPTDSYGFLRLRTGGAVVDERIYLPGHLGGFGKRISVASDDPADQSGYCEVATLNGPACVPGGPADVTYGCDTQGGGSGSPVIAYSDQRVVALHHCSSGGGRCPNKGVPIELIVQDLRATGQLPSCAVEQFEGTVAFNAASFSCSSIATIQVKDDSIARAGTLTVTVSSTTESTPETVVLREFPPRSGTFLGSFPMTPDPVAVGDGVLSVAEGDTITVTYLDADDGAGGHHIPVSAAATIDCRAPLISDVAVPESAGNRATISWQTDEPATSVVHYAKSGPGAALSALTGPGARGPGGAPSRQATGSVLKPQIDTESDLVASSDALVTSHSVVLTGLDECSTYKFEVSSLDEAGNSASDDYGGRLYTLQTFRTTRPAYSGADTPLAIPDHDPAGANSAIIVTDPSLVTDVNVTVNITHTFDGDLTLELIPPTGPAIILSERRGSLGDNYTGTTFDDAASTAIGAGAAPFTGSFKPDSPLSAANGIDAAGRWTLRVIDGDSFDVGTLESWTLTLTYAPGACGPSLAYRSSTVSDACGGTGTGAGNGVVEPGEDVVLPLRLLNNGTTRLARISATISTSVPGVSVTQGSATYPDLVAGASAVGNAPPFAFSVDASVPCGTLIPFDLVATADQGTWTETFTVRVGASGSATSTYDSSDVPQPILDPPAPPTNAIVTVADSATVTDVNVRVDISHTWDGDVNIFLVGPNGTAVELSTGNGASGDNYTGTVFDDEAPAAIGDGAPPFTGSFKPESPLSVFDGISAGGTWTLRIVDTATTEQGTLNAWSLELTTASGSVCDSCAPRAPGVSSGDLVWAPGSKTRLQWGAVPGAASYHVYQGTCALLPRLPGGIPDSCLRTTTQDTTTGPVLTEQPADDCVFWYLVTPERAGGAGPTPPPPGGARFAGGTADRP